MLKRAHVFFDSSVQMWNIQSSDTA